MPASTVLELADRDALAEDSWVMAPHTRGRSDLYDGNLRLCELLSESASHESLLRAIVIPPTAGFSPRR